MVFLPKSYPMNKALTSLLFTSLLGLSPSLLKGCARPALSQSSTTTPTTSTVATPQTIAEQLATHYLKKQPAPELPLPLTLDQAWQVQEQFIEKLIPSLGQRIGYKAGLTNAIAQQRFQISHPVRGTLLEKMLVKSGANIPANFGTRPILEGDLIVRVSSETINQASTPQDVLNAIDAVIPFLELADLVYAEEAKINASSIIAINVGARLGIIGTPIPLTPDQDWQTRLKRMKLQILEETGTPKELATGDGQALLGDPLSVVLWLKDSLKAQGKSLKKGDLLSLGTITPVVPVKAGAKISAQYLDLDPKGTVEISVNFQ